MSGRNAIRIEVAVRLAGLPCGLAGTRTRQHLFGVIAGPGGDFHTAEHPGNFIGITHNEHYEFTVSALTAAKIREIPIKPFIALQDEVSQLQENVRRIGGNILAHTLDQVFALGQKKAHERVCFLLKQLSDRMPAQRGHLIELAMTRQDIADYLGLTIETVSRAFGKLKREGVIDIYSAHTVEILDKATIEELALAD